MIFSLYLLSILYTNTMGLIIIAKCKPFINREIEKKGYLIKEKDDITFVTDALVGGLKFFIPAYYLKKAIELSGKDFNIEKIIKDGINKGEISTTEDVSLSSRFIDESFSKPSLSLGKYEKVVPYKAINESMYLDRRLEKDEDIDMDFWDEKEENIVPYLEEQEETVKIKKDPVKEYIDSISDEQLNDMVNQLDTIMKLKRANESLLNQNHNN